MMEFSMICPVSLWGPEIGRERIKGGFRNLFGLKEAGATIEGGGCGWNAEKASGGAKRSFTGIQRSAKLKYLGSKIWGKKET